VGVSDGVYEYYCFYHASTMFGRFIVGSPAIRHDIAVTGVATSVGSVGQGGTTSIIVDVGNKGDALESFNVAAFYDDLLIGSLQHVPDLWLGESRRFYFFIEYCGRSTGYLHGKG